MKNERFKPCPFCGHIPCEEFMEVGTPRLSEIRVICDLCGCSLGFSLSKEAAIKQWNKRV